MCPKTVVGPSSLTGIASGASTTGVAPPTLKVSAGGSCGRGSRKLCLGSGFGNCCSGHGWCGSADAYCDDGCQVEFGHFVTAGE